MADSAPKTGGSGPLPAVSSRPPRSSSPGWKPPHGPQASSWAGLCAQTLAAGPRPGVCPLDGEPRGGWPGATAAPPEAQPTHSEPEPWAWALPARTFMAMPFRCSRPGSRRGILMVMAPSGVRSPSLEPTEDEREDAGLCSHSASFSRSRDFSVFSVNGGG